MNRAIRSRALSRWLIPLAFFVIHYLTDIVDLDRQVAATIFYQNNSTAWIDASFGHGANVKHEPKQELSSRIKPKKYAYAVVIGGCDPEHSRTACRGFIYNILVTRKILQELGSMADFVAYFQLSVRTNQTELPEEDVRLLRAMNVTIRYIQKSRTESFYDIVMNKFRILELTQYSRVILMDGDIMPFGNMDYLFQLSESSVLKENVIIAGNSEPANAGFFMLRPGENEYDALQQIIRDREENSIALEGYKFDPVVGWGHKIVPPDSWESRRSNGTLWDFHFAFSDQGLLYHWTKYVKNSVSIVFQDRVENWSENKNGNAVLERVIDKPFVNYSQPILFNSFSCLRFMCDFAHFSGKKKPWLRQPPPADKNATAGVLPLWWHTLKRIDKDLGMGLDFNHWKVFDKPSLGLYTTLAELSNRVVQNKIALH